MRFLSHQETLRVIARAIIRSETRLIYSQGYNPHPKLSLPLPRNVGLASDDELFCARIQSSDRREPEFADSIGQQFPEGLEIVSVEITDRPVVYQPIEVEYLVKATLSEKQKQFLAKIQKINEWVQAGSEILIERTVDKEGSVKTVDVGRFLKFFEAAEHGVRVFCKVLPTGTIRPDEILRLLDMDSYETSSSIIRKKVIWQMN